MATHRMTFKLIALGLTVLRSTGFTPTFTAKAGLRRPAVLSPSKFLSAQQTPLRSLSSSLVVRRASETDGTSALPPMLDPGTKGGALVVTSLLCVIPVLAYNALLALGFEDTAAGPIASGSFVVISIVLWTASYMFRVANKDMTYAKQLKTYEDAVIAKRLEELEDDEVDALMADLERE
mmetsp:Transcript_83979/g.168179  ORF Transcript_83979/g.168179 Transcript_83979/m.168179 type:complete len:179 (+) Transcript_83979:16-552(+)